MDFDRVHETLEDPDITYPSNDGLGRLVYRNSFQTEKYFVVLIEEPNNEATIITVAKDG
jgi:hypothetical protein